MRRLLLLTNFFLCMIIIPGLRAQGLIIRLHDGTENSRLITSIRKLSFPDNNLVVTPKTGSPDTFPLSEIQKVYFGEVVSVPEPLSSDKENLHLYPNPSDKEISILNIPEGTSAVYIYKMDGRLVRQATVASGTVTINIEDLTSGIYFLIAGDRTAKFIRL